MTTAKPIPAAYLRSEEFARQKREHRQKEWERRQRRHERVTQRLAAALGEKIKEVRMDEQHPDRLFIPPQDLEKFFDLLDKSRGGTVGQHAFYDWLAHKWPQTSEGTWRVGWDNILHPYIEPMPKDTPEAQAQEVARLTQELGVAQAKAKQLTVDELKSKMLTLLEPGETVTVSKPDPNAPTGPVLVKPDDPKEPDHGIIVTELPGKPTPAPEPVPAQ